MWVYWYKKSDIGQNIQEVITRLNIRRTYGYLEDKFLGGVLHCPTKEMYGMNPNEEHDYFLITTRHQIYQANLLISMGLNEEEIKSIIGDNHVD